MKWDLRRVAEVTRGEVSGSATIESVVIDSREARPGCLFVGVRGENDDGHRYIDAALEAGAAAVMVERGLDDRPGVQVADTTEALLALAVARREELSLDVIAVTGSSGKTTTKDLLASVLGPGTYSSPRSFNNEFGVPLTLLSTPGETRVLVVEVGSRGKGDIRALAPAIRPVVSLITNVGRAHLETFGSVDGVTDAKWELVEALLPGGRAVLPAEQEILLTRAGDLPVVTFGEESGADVDAREVRLDDSGRASFVLEHGDELVDVRLPIPGRHQPRNAAAAVAGAVALGRPFGPAAAALEEAAVSPWRMELSSVAIDGGDAVVVNDAYNANPDSMDAALETVAAMPGRHLAVLGKMHELGDYEREAHRSVGRRAADLGFTVIAVGEDPGLSDGAGTDSVSVPDSAAALEVLRAELRPGDVVLIKASRAAGLEGIAAALIGGSA